MTDRSALRKLASEATTEIGLSAGYCPDHGTASEQFYAAARTAIPDLLDQLDRAEAELAAMAAARDEACDACAHACFVIPRGRVTVAEKQTLDDFHGTSIRLRSVGQPK